MKEYWQNLQARERRTLLAGAAALVVMLLYILVWEPYHAHIERLETDVAEQRETLAWMQRAAKEIERLRGNSAASPSVASEGSLLTTTDRTAREHGFSEALKRIQPDGQRSVRVWLENAPFDDMVRWLDALASEHGVTVSTLVVDPADSSGRIDARLVLKEAG